MRKYIFILTLCLLCQIASEAQQPFLSATDKPYGSSPKREVRAVWLTTIGGLDWPHSYSQSTRSAEKQQEELGHTLDQYRRAGINTILLQTRIRATTLYPSVYEPWDGCLSGFPGKSPGYDALKFAIDECHKRGMEIQAWVVTLPVGKWNALGCKRLRKKFPGLIRRIGSEGYMNPEDPRTARYLADFCEEITRNYDIDGIHLDYIRYPEKWPLKVSREEGRRNITAIVRAIHDRVKAIKPWVKMSCSPVGKFDDLSRYWSHGWNAYTKVCQDAQGWLRDGLMDQLYPMMYFRGDQFFPFAIDWQEQSHGRTVVPGLGIYFLSPKEGNWQLDDVTREMQVLREYGMGHAYFRGRFLTDNTQGILDFVSQFDRQPALVPAMTWENSFVPDAPENIKVSAQSLKWSGSTPYYNVYASRTYPVDINNGANLIAARIPTTMLQVPTEGRFFAVTGMDHYGNESQPLQSHSAPDTIITKGPGLLPCDGKQMILPPKPAGLDAELVTVETLQGAIVATLPYRSDRIYVASIPDGFYVVRSLNRKGVSHRIGYLKKSTQVQ